MVELLRDCLKNNDERAWTDLWLLFTDTVTERVRYHLLDYGFNEEDAQDVVMEISAELFAGKHEKLRSFRGETRGELCQWFLRVGINHARNWINRWRCRARNTEAYALESQRQSPGPTESDVRMLLDELEEAAHVLETGITPQVVFRLRILSGLEIIDGGLSDRSIRHWKQDLLPRCRRIIRHE